MKKIICLLLVFISIFYVTSCTNPDNDTNKVDEVIELIELINKLPEEITLNDEEQIENIVIKYNNLTNDEKNKVTNYQKLIDSQNKLAELKQVAADKEQAQNVIDLINNLPSLNELKLTDEQLVLNARTAYNNLTAEQKQYVTNYSTLISLENKIKELKQVELDKAQAQIVIDLINELPNVNELKLEDKGQVLSALNAYNSLTDKQKTYVDNYDILDSLIKQLNNLENSKTYQVYFNLNGGFMDGLTEVNTSQTVLEFDVNYYSTDFFNYYTTDIFIYKTSLLDPASSYLYAYKVGFSFDDSLNKYVVDQIIPNETGLNSSNKTSEYFILVHTSYPAGFEQIKTIKVGQHLSFNCELPSDATTTLNAKCTVSEIGTNVLYMKEYKGINTLEVPVKDGYSFVGWYLNSDFSGEKITEVSDTVTVYAKWTIDKGEITTSTILNCVSDIVTSSTEDLLILENADATFTWSTSDSKLYSINGNIGKTSKIYQTHKNQKVTVSVVVKYTNGDEKTLSKEITIAPVLFNNISTTPVATYFYTGAISAYQRYNERYLKEGTYFSLDTKETLDIVYYAFMVPYSDGTVSFQNTSYIEEVKKLKEHDVRILGCVNGVGRDTSQAFKTITADATLRKKFINNLMDLVEKYNLDGLDIDWEAIDSTLKPVASQLNLLITELRAEMDLRQAEGGTPYMITMAVPASSYGTATDRFDFVTLNKYVDYINIMSYDLNKTNITTHLSPLYKSEKDNGYGFGCDYGVNRLVSLGMSKNKLIIGCAGYGKAYKVTGAISQTYPGLGVAGSLTQISGLTGSFQSGTVYGSAINILINSGNYVEYTEKNSSGKVVGSYLFNSTDKIFITYDSREAVIAKYNYAAANPGVGLMCWAYTEDTSDTVINAMTEAKNAIYK